MVDVVTARPIVVRVSAPIPIGWPWWGSLLWGTSRGFVETPFGSVEVYGVCALPPLGSNLLSWN